MINERLLLLDSSSDSDLDDALLLEVLDRRDIQYRAQLHGNATIVEISSSSVKRFLDLLRELSVESMSKQKTLKTINKPQ